MEGAARRSRIEHGDTRIATRYSEALGKFALDFFVAIRWSRKVKQQANEEAPRTPAALSCDMILVLVPYLKLPLRHDEGHWEEIRKHRHRVGNVHDL